MIANNSTLIDDDLLLTSSTNNGFYKQNVNTFVLNIFLRTKIQHIAWHIFHSFSIMYPNEPTAEQQLMTKNFINKLTTNLGIVCSSCGRTKDRFISTYDIDLAVSSKLNLVEFFRNYHIFKKKFSGLDFFFFSLLWSTDHWQSPHWGLHTVKYLYILFSRKILSLSLNSN